MAKNIVRDTGQFLGVSAIKACTFFGHKDAPERIKPTLRSAIMDLIINKNVRVFYVGNHGHFDLMAHALLKELSFIYPITYYVVLAYMPTDKRVDNPCEANTLLPDGIEAVPPRFAICYRNKWMVKNADFVITYVTHSWGGAAQFKKMAENKKKTVVELGSL